MPTHWYFAIVLYLNYIFSNCLSSFKWVLRKHLTFSLFALHSWLLVPELSEPVGNYLV